MQDSSFNSERSMRGTESCNQVNRVASLIVCSSLNRINTSAYVALYARHTQRLPDRRYGSWQEVHGIDGTKGNQQACQLLEPGVEIRRCHEQHPPTQTRDRQSGLDPNSHLFSCLSICRSVFCLVRCFPHQPICRQDSSGLSETLHAHDCRQEFQPQHCAAQDEQEDVTAYVMSAFPLSANGLTRGVRKDLFHLASFCLVC